MTSTDMIGETFASSGYNGEHFIGNSAHFSPIMLQDSEFKRRTRNNSILSKIQELEANASIHAARSERFRLMREEYETLVRKYASTRNPGQGLFFNGNLNGTNGYLQHQGRIDQQNPHIIQDNFRPAQKTFATKGVNTEITGPVKSVTLEESKSLEKDTQHKATFQAEGPEKVKVIVNSESQTGVDLEHHSASAGHFAGEGMEVKLPHSGRPEASSSTRNVIYDGREKPNHKAIGKSGEDQIKEVFPNPGSMTVFKSKNLSTNKMEKMMSMIMLEDEDDDESFLEQHERKRKLQLQEFHQQPRAISHGVDDSGSLLITSEEGTGTNSKNRDPTNRNNSDFPPMSHTLADENEGLLKVGQKQRQEPMKEKTTVHERLEVMLEKNRSRPDEDSVDDSTFTNDRKGAGANDGGGGYTDPSFSESVSVFQKHEAQRKKLLHEIGESVARNAVKRKGKLSEEQDDSYSESSNDEKEKSVQARKYNAGDDDDPTTGGGGGGATSESLGDSLMDSIHKPSDTLPKDDDDDDETRANAKLYEIKESRGKLGEKAEIKFSSFSYGPPPGSDEGFMPMVTTTAALNQPLKYEPDEEKSEHDVSDRLTKIPIKRFNLEFAEEIQRKEQAIDVEVNGIHSGNLSSSKFDVPAGEVGNIIDANISKNYVPEEEVERETKEDERKLSESGNEVVEGVIEMSKEGMITLSSANLSVHPSSSDNVVTFEVTTKEGVDTKNQQESSGSCSSSPSYSRQRSLDGKEETLVTAETNTQNPNNKVDEEVVLKRDSLDASSLPQSKQLQEEAQKEGDGKERRTSPPAGMAEERLSSSFSFTSGMYTSTNGGTQVNTSLDKVGKVEMSSNAFPSPSSKKKGVGAGVASDSGKGNGVTGGVSNIRSGTRPNTKSLKSSTVSGIPPKPVSHTTVPTGPPGARNTGRRVRRIKLNYDDSESDSSEISGKGGNEPGKKIIEQKPANGIKSNNNGVKNEEPKKEETSQSKQDDDDFDDFFDI